MVLSTPSQQLYLMDRDVCFYHIDRGRSNDRQKLSDPALGTRGLQPERDGRVRCSA